MRNRWRLVVAFSWTLIAVSAFTNVAEAQESDNGAQVIKNADRPLEYWIDQLSHDQYLRREAAKKRLIDAGEAAVSVLASAIRNGDLETTTLAIRVLSDLALQQSPRDDNGALGILTKIATESTGSRQASAQSAVKEVYAAREREAVVTLDDAGIPIVLEPFVIGAEIAPQKLVLRIDKRWNGDREMLHWLRWVRSIQYASLSGDAVNGDVVAEVVKMPDLRTIALIDGTADMKTIEALSRMPRINSLEVRYVELSPEMIDGIVKLPIRESLGLMGTGIPTNRASRLSEELPGLKILHRSGGFLGVSCDRAPTFCKILSVFRESAAEAAGLRAMDIVTSIDGKPVVRFEDLQEIIGSHFAGDTLKVTFTRQGEQLETTVDLRRQNN